jgi:predicted XRE-type DNA-binding protein
VTHYNARVATCQSLTNELIGEAIALRRLGWSVLPLKPASKEPLISWRELQRRKLEEHEIISLFERHPDANIGVVTGTASGLLVLDCDAPDVVKRLGVSETPIAETARGRHYYFELPKANIRSVAGIADGLDIRAEGGYVVAPPSVHPSGKRYEWLIPPRGLDPYGALPAPPPQWLMELLRKRRSHSRPVREIVYGVEEGERNVSSAALIGKLLGCLPVDDWESIAWPLVRAWNEQNTPKLDTKQLRSTFDCIARKELKKRAKIENEAQFIKKLAQFIKNNFSQRQLAKELNVNQSTVSRALKAITSSNISSRRITFESKISNGLCFLTSK